MGDDHLAELSTSPEGEGEISELAVTPTNHDHVGVEGCDVLNHLVDVLVIQRGVQKVLTSGSA